MAAKLALLFVLGLASGCLDTQDASLGEQEEERSQVDAASDAAEDDAGPSALDGGSDVPVDAELDAESEEEETRDAATSLLCRLEPWHCL
jgi:hypothetical protein